MASEYIRLLKEALQGNQRLQQPPVRPNRTLLVFANPQDLVMMSNRLTVSASGVIHPPQWGPTTNGPNGANWQWNLSQWG